MSVCWPNLPKDVKRIIVEPLCRIDRLNLRQCSWGDKLFVDLVSKPIREVNFMASRSYIIIRYDEEYEDYFGHSEGNTEVRRSKNLLPFNSFSMSEDFQIVAWRSLQKMMKSQNNEIDTLNFSFIGRLNFNEEDNEQQIIIPNLPEKTLNVRKLSIFLDSSEEMTKRIVQFAKPGLDSLNVSITVKNVNDPSEMGSLEQLKTAKKIRSNLMLTLNHSMELEGDEVINKTTLINDEGVVELLKKSLSSGKPSKFHYNRLWPDIPTIVSSFDSIAWSLETSEQFDNLGNHFKIDLSKKNFILSNDNSSLFVEFDKFSARGFILNKQ
ncbi:hypothetical protein L3Y34_014973 [Caenorhabditis briggsae]|uniref:F-box domain-containing protein n=1 Tax=Caenorhabditis briggsae TaxID=6238 RepID=A0AAE9IYA4_CAEBR|nr:hypothetical protein L3Y34_014973 [Caenorhabditis briggsae]